MSMDMDASEARLKIAELTNAGLILIGSYIIGVGSDPDVLKSTAAGKLPKDAVIGPLILNETFYPLGVGFYR